ncbi:MAG TPA: hypothetical protein VH740_10770 [Vicinamibacterales bacterium]|jgi:hypothetical protein
MPTRGSYNFEIDNNGALVDNPANAEKLRSLFRDDAIINGNWGPGNFGDFDNGSWHILCHLAGGSGVLNTRSGRAWCGITHVPANDTYQASIVVRRNGAVATLPLGSGEGAALANGAEVLGYIEGSSVGHISARGVNDPPNAFNRWPRQSFDKDATSDEDGGTVWEHWCTTRDIRPTSAIGSSVVKAYTTLVSRLGGRYVAAVARGRREHNHPKQLAALVKAGLLTPGDATWDVNPDPIPRAAQDLLYEARPGDALAAAESLPFTPGAQRYFMFQRRIRRWSRAQDVKRDLGI